MRNKLRRETLISIGPATQFFSRGLSVISQGEINEIGIASAEKSLNPMPMAQLRLRTGTAVLGTLLKRLSSSLGGKTWRPDQHVTMFMAGRHGMVHGRAFGS